MKRSVIALVLLITVSVAAEPRIVNKPVTCDSIETVFRALVEQFQETPQWRGRTGNTNIVLTVNLKTGAWSLVEYTATTACIIGVGENSSSAWGVPV